MKKTIALPEGYKTCEFLLVLRPNETLCNKILETRIQFSEKYKTQTVKGIPYITLVKFTQYEVMQERIISRINNIAEMLAPFTIEFQNLGSFPSHTIYFDIATKGSINNLIKQLKFARSLMTLPGTKPHFMEEPYLALARKLLPWQYEKGWLEYSHLNFSGMFIADNILLLKRKDNSQYQTVSKFPLQGVVAQSTQGILF